VEDEQVLVGSDDNEWECGGIECEGADDVDGVALCELMSDLTLAMENLELTGSNVCLCPIVSKNDGTAFAVSLSENQKILPNP
jgi:hypothetical protein